MDGFKQGLLEFEGFDGTGHGGTPPNDFDLLSPLLTVALA